MYRWTVRTLFESRPSRYVPWRVRRRLEEAAFVACRFRDGPTTISVAQGPAAATIAAVGDVALTRVLDDGADPADALEGVRELLGAADLRVANLETVLAVSGQRVGQTGSFLRARPPAVAALVTAGIDAVTCANNHCTDFGGEALHESVEHLRAAGIAACGVGATDADARRPVLRTVNGVRVGMLGYCDDWRALATDGHVPAASDDASILADVAALRPRVDVLVLQLHWGWEWSVHPLLSHRDRARRFAEAGADVVLCHHAHVPMALEAWGRSVIAHGLGNFRFPWGGRPTALREHPWRDRSFALHVAVSAAGVHEARITPIELRGRTVVPSEDANRREMLGGLAALGGALGNSRRLAAIERDRCLREGRDLGRRLDSLVAGGDAVRLAEAAATLHVPRGRTLIAGLAGVPDGSGAPLAVILGAAADGPLGESIASLSVAARDGRLGEALAHAERSAHLAREPLGRTP